MNQAKKPARILVVDDEERNRRLLAAMLEAEGHVALEAADGTQALELARQSPPDLVLLDIMMPGMDGYEVVRALKANAVTKAIPVVMVTALDDRGSRLRGLEAGAEEFVGKPVDRNELRIRVRNLLRLKEFSDFLENHNRILEERVRERTAKVARLNRVYSVLSGINTTIVRVRERDELFAKACRIAVEDGKFVMAWIGLLDPATQDVTPVAKAGRDDGYLSQINLTVREGTPGNCALVAQALTEVAPVVCNDIASDDRISQWRTEALQRGYRSVALFPLVVESRPVGIFVLYASDPNAFDDEEMRLLIEVAGDIAFALDHLAKEEKINYLAYYDAITGLPNRALFWDRLDQRLTAARGDQQAFSVIMLDLDRFSAINESLGRQTGDDLLRELGGCLKLMLDERDVLAHLADDRFAIATKRGDSETDIAHLVEQILAGIQSRTFKVGGTELRVTVRAGLATFPADGNDIESLYRNAEAALREAKKTGSRYRFYAPKMNAMVAARLTLENKLRKAVENQEFVLHYQPKISLSTGHVCGLEALMRWADPETGMVPPGMFISLLEETGMILEVGKWAVMQALTDFERWRAAGVDPVSIAVNVSAIQLAQSDFVASVQAAIAEANGNAANLELEITESLVMENIDQNIPKLKAIRELGATIAIDDFGTGYSSLSYIAKLPISSLKIDRSFIVSMADAPDSMAIVQTIISLAHSLGLKVVAEGVETEEQEKLLRLLRCEEVQGFRFSRPVPADKILDLLQRKVIVPTKR
jgi:diguanylate cyclase (GGDEF)-like protein